MRRITILLTVMVLTAGACSGGDPLEDYFGDVGEITDELAASVGALPSASTSGTLSDARAYFSGVDEALRDAVAALENVAVPEGMGSAHQTFVATVAEYARLAEQAAVRGSSLESRDDLLEMANDEGVGVAAFREAREAALDACLLMRVVAANPEIDVEVDCAAFTADGGRSASSPLRTSVALSVPGAS